LQIQSIHTLAITRTQSNTPDHNNRNTVQVKVSC